MILDLTNAVFEGAIAIEPRGLGGSYMPYNYTGAPDELLACRNGAWLSVSLNSTPTYDIWGPDAVKLLNSVCVNRDFSKLKEGLSRHAIICNEKGQMLADGVIIKTGADHFRSYWVAPLAYYVEKSDLDVQGAFIMDEYFYQLDGPRSLEILEKACDSDLHDIQYAHNRMVKIDGMEMRVHRLGMSGSLAYELHGPAEDADKVYRKIKEAGADFGLKPMGGRHYCVNHTQAGIPNQWIHYYYPYFSSGKEMAEYFGHFMPRLAYVGSCAEDEENYYVTPYEVSWGNLVNFNHEFPGKAALQKIAANPPRTAVTLEWNAEDVADVFASQFRGSAVTPYDSIERPWEGVDAPAVSLRADKVLVNGKFIGPASGRINDYYHRKCISLAFIDKEYAVEGTPVIVLWGTPGHPQKEIRAIVATFPYFNEDYRNETCDVEKIPRLKKQ